MRNPQRHNRLIFFIAVVAFYQSYHKNLASGDVNALTIAVLSVAKSSNVLVRTNAVNLLKAILSRSLSDDEMKQLTEAILLPLNSGKTTGPDHRHTLYSMLAVLPVNQVASQMIVKATVPLLEKETNDASLSIVAETLSKHLIPLMRDNKIDQSSVLSVSKEISSSKLPLRRAVTTICGEVLWELSRGDVPWPPSAEKLLESILPALEKTIKDTPTTSSTTGQTPVDAWVTVAVLVGSSRKCTLGTLSRTSFGVWLTNIGQMSNRKRYLLFRAPRYQAAKHPSFIPTKYTPNLGS